VTELDPHDAISWYWTASTLTDPQNLLLSTSPKLAQGVRPLNPAPLAATAPPVAPRTADLVASSRRVA